MSHQTRNLIKSKIQCNITLFLSLSKKKISYQPTFTLDPNATMVVEFVKCNHCIRIAVFDVTQARPFQAHAARTRLNMHQEFRLFQSHLFTLLPLHLYLERSRFSCRLDKSKRRENTNGPINIGAHNILCKYHISIVFILNYVVLFIIRLVTYHFQNCVSPL